MSLRERDNKMIVKSNFVISCLTFKGSISTKFKGKESRERTKVKISVSFVVKKTT